MSKIKVNTIENVAGTKSVSVDDVLDHAIAMQTQFSHRNKFINGDFKTWARSGSFTNINTHTYTADRWNVIGTDVGVTQDASTSEQGYAIRLASTVNIGNIKQGIELRDTVEFAAGKTFTLSFWAYQVGGTSTCNYDVWFRDSLGSVTNEVEVVPIGAVLGTISGWTKLQATFTIPTAQASTNNQMLVIIRPPADVTVFKIAQAQLEEGSVATPFEQRPITYDRMLCKRYFQKVYSHSAYRSMSIANPYTEGATFTGLVAMRTNSPIVDKSGITYDGCSYQDETVGMLTLGIYYFRVDVPVNTLYRAYGVITFDTEL